MDLKQLVVLALQGSLMLTIFGFGLRASPDDALYLVRRPGLLARSFLAMFVAVPILVVGLVRVFHLTPTLEACMVALAISPIPPLLPKKLTKAGGKEGYAVGLLVTMALLSIVVAPLAVNLLGRYFDRSLTMAPGPIAKMVIMAALLPLLAGMVFRRLLPTIAHRIEKPVSIVSSLVLAGAALLLIVAAWRAVMGLATASTLLGLTSFVVIGLAIGHLLGGPDPGHRSVLALSSASRHPGIALAIVSANFPDERFGGTILLYLLVSAVVCIPYIKWAQRSTAPATAGA